MARVLNAIKWFKSCSVYLNRALRMASRKRISAIVLMYTGSSKIISLGKKLPSLVKDLQKYNPVIQGGLQKTYRFLDLLGVQEDL